MATSMHLNAHSHVRIMDTTMWSLASSESRGVYRDTIAISAFAAAASLILLILQALCAYGRHRTIQDANVFEKSHVDALGGRSVFFWMVFRLLCSLALLALEVSNLLADGIGDVYELVVFSYSFLLALVAIGASLRWSTVATRHYNSVLLVAFGVYFYRDLYPVMTFTESPQDAALGGVLWVKVGLITFLGVVLPLGIPRPYIPLDPKNPMPEPNPEQTASIFSLLMHYYLESLVFKAYSLPHLPFSELPPLADYDEAAGLKKRAFSILDQFSGAKKQHMFFGLMRIFRWDYFVITVTLVLQVIAGFLSPIGLNRLLSYLETHGENAVVRPWVWISGLFFGPVFTSIALQWYIYTATHLVTLTNAILIELTFEHSLRIRLKAATSEPSSTPASSPSTAEGSVNSADESETVHDSSTSVNSEAIAKPTTSVKSEASHSDTSNLVGKINNLVTTDLENIGEARDFMILVVYVPLQVALCIVFLYLILGWSAFVGLAVILLTLPVPGLVAKFTQAIQENRLKRTDSRVQLVTEILNVQRMIKIFGWEKKMEEMIAEKRQNELVWIRKRQLLDLVNGSLNYFIPLFTMVITFGFYVCSMHDLDQTVVMKEKLTASIVFSSMSVFDMLRDQLHLIFDTITWTIAGKVSLDRMTSFLQETELLDCYTSRDGNLELYLTHAPKDTIGFNDASFVWSNDADGRLTSSKRNFNLKVEKLEFKKGCFNLIIGPTGSGKTSLLMALLGEMHFIPNGPLAWYNLPREKGVAYAAQESWVQNETIRDNILFGSPYDEARYNEVICQCGLTRDLTLFEAGDRTEVGEKGLTLSGGQKARVSLARAIYSDAEIVLLDDVLAALDVHTSKGIVEKCFSGDLAKGRTIILITHNVALVEPIASHVVSIKDGRIVASGPVSAVIPTLDFEVKAELAQWEEKIEKAEQEVDVSADEPSHDIPEVYVNKNQSGQLILKEELQEGHISWPALKLYLNALGGSQVWVFFLAFLGGLALSHLTYIVQTWWLGYWASRYEGRNDAHVPAFLYISIYTVLAMSGVVFYCCGYLVYVLGALRASREIHKSLVKTVLGTTLRWLDTTPTSRIITRCTQDIRALDGPVALWFLYVVDLSIILFTKFLAIVAVTPIFIIPSIVVFVAGAITGQVYIKAQLSVKREMSNAKAPVLSHFGAAIGGLTSIRAYSAQNRFIAESLVRIDRYSRASRTFFNLNRWICIRVDVLGGLFASALASYLVYFLDDGALDASTTGFQLNMAIGFSALILWWIRTLNEFEVQGNSLERIQQYLSIDQEPAPTPEGEPPAYWPASGNLRVENLSASYSVDGPKVLHNVSFELKSGERVGVVGRTGSGKSSLTLALLRCICNVEGEVWYDGVETSKVNLERLRKAIGVIPQMPELLSGTLRQNLDPFDQYDDAALNNALRAAGLFSLQEEDSATDQFRDDATAKITLDTPIASGGNNLSVGQRQILALARALVRGSKLLILDEATSAIDYKTDAVIQSSLRSELASADVTLITVAHRLQTIMDADKIMVLDAGRIVEFGTPKDLVAIDGGKLRSLIDESRDRDVLLRMAKGGRREELASS